LQSTCVFTNTTTVAAYRGAGRPEAAYYLERLIDVVALDLGKAPEEVRRRNFIPPSAFPYKAPTGQNYDSGEYDGALTKALELAVDFDKIVVRHGDTLNTPMGNGTGGSRSLAVGGSAILQAALRVQDKARRIAAHLLEAAPVDIAYTDGRYQVKGVPDRALGF